MDLVNFPGLHMLKPGTLGGKKTRIISHEPVGYLGANPYLGGFFLVGDVLRVLGGNTNFEPDPAIEIKTVKVLFNDDVCVVQIANISNLYRILEKDTALSPLLVKVEKEDVYHGQSWNVNGVTVGAYKTASVLLSEPALCNVKCYFKKAELEWLYIRQLGECSHADGGDQIKYRYVLEDVAKHLFCNGIEFWASKWIHGIDISHAPSLMRIEGGNSVVRVLIFTRSFANKCFVCLFYIVYTDASSLVQYGPLTVVSHEDLAQLFNDHSCIRGLIPFAPEQHDVEDDSSAPVVSCQKKWSLAGDHAGILVNAAILKTFQGLEALDESVLKDNVLRQFSPGQRDNLGEDVGGYFIFGDIVVAAVTDSRDAARRWIKKNIAMNTQNFPSLKIVERGEGMHHVLHAVIAKEDIVKLLSHDSDLKALLSKKNPGFEFKMPDTVARSLAPEIRDLKVTATASPSALVGGQRFLQVPTSVLKTLSGFEQINIQHSEHKNMRQLGRQQVDDKGNDISGFFVLADAGARVLFKEPSNACRWANNRKQVNTEVAPSLTYIDSGNAHVSLLKFTKI